MGNKKHTHQNHSLPAKAKQNTDSGEEGSGEVDCRRFFGPSMRAFHGEGCNANVMREQVVEQERGGGSVL